MSTESHTMDAKLAAEYAAAADAWRAFCAARLPNRDASGEPLAVVLLAGLCEPLAGDVFSGDIITDVLAGLRAFVKRVEQDAADGGGGGLFIYNDAIDAWLRRLDALVVLRGRESAARAARDGVGPPERAAREGAGAREPGGAP
jgi:hypothetical protein